MKSLFYLQDFCKLKNYQKACRSLFPDIDGEYVNDKITFLKKLETKDYDLVFFCLINDIQDFSIIRELNSKIPIVIIVENFESAVRILKTPFSSMILDIITEDDFFNTSLTSLYFRCIKRNMEENNKKHLVEIIERGQKFWLTVFDNLPELVLIVDDKGFIVRCNIPFSNLFGKHPRELIGKKAEDVIDLKIIKNLSFDNLPSYYEESFNGRYYYITLTKIVFEGKNNIILFFKDITEYQRMKEHLYQKDKYTSIGTLASGIAHEINNPLTGIIGFTQMLKMVNNCKDYIDTLNKILECADRCKKVVESLLIYARQKSSSKSLESINNIVERTIDLVIYNLRKNNINIKTELENVPLMLLDGQQIQQVIINMILNAQDAILSAKREKGEIVIKTSFDEIKKKIFIKIIDNGIGIKKDILPKIFDPFFTTKSFGESMGLGLSISYGIIKQHNGNIIVESKENVGTTFVIELPME